MRSRDGKTVSSSERLLGDFAASTLDVELEYFKQLYRHEFKSAFQEALDSLQRRQRNLLRHQIVDGLNVTQIGRIYHVSRSTAARQLTDARQTLIRRTRECLLGRLQVGSSEMHSIMRIIESRLDISVRRMLQPESPATGD